MSYCETLRLQAVPGKAANVLLSLAGLTDVGLWSVDIGLLNRIYVMRVSDSPEALDAAPLDAPEASLPFLQGVERTRWRCLGAGPKPAGHYGGVYEWRCYDVNPGRSAEAEALFLASLPGRETLSPLVAVMASIDGPQRFAHLWPYADPNARAAIRARSVQEGLWPPPGFALTVSRMENELLIPAQNSAWR
ncbi:NIPSNAP family protein [Acidomonas methanolica]|uniref:NIPSNAP domain-containing protein n=2 Tax=Acidomonas methanolica TaxID=437 RepID=A0A023D466_ACIMT|nr:NIPSNAP family protein [Acidomonas methanolica]MBU2654503.1 NIPSNAP family protein [Acidomonas methanolica]TCS28306.1 NIPSNAP protein [Acidomonas methanolica]GAJ28560.1 hypothetical protein Amme_031_022 [Acidomonas methanolica NBRC 104435]GEK99023.1 hypothetical protein AME01nite_15220 [Acidomonas methanolica NBRC 104435]